MIEEIGRWLDARLHTAKFFRRALNHVFPDHWSFMLGEIALYSFVILVITGTYLALFFKASSDQVIYHGTYHALSGVRMSEAYRSVLDLSFDVPAGLLVRQMHHWTSLIFVGAIVAHAARIFFTSAYRRPREMNWLIGLTLLVLALVNGFLGYSILDDVLSGTGLRIGYAIMLSIPVIGPWVTFLFLGGNVPVATTIPRFYSLHIFLIPALIAALLALHLGIVWRQLHTNYPGPRRTNASIVGSRLWPSYAAKSIGLLLFLFAVVAMLGGLVQIDPVWIYGPYNPDAVITGAQPDWYLGWVEGAMRLFPGVNLRVGEILVIPAVFFPAVLLPLLLFGTLYAFPFLDKPFPSDEKAHNVLRLPYEQPLHTAFGCAVLMFLLVLFFAGGDDVIAVATGTSVVQIRTILRVLVFGAPAATAALVYLLCIGARRRHAVPRPSPDESEAA